MTSGTRNGLVIALIHLGLVASLGAKLQIDRAVRPRVWARTAPVDPNLPIRGRYVQLAIEGEPGAGLLDGDERNHALVRVEHERLVIDRDEGGGSPGGVVAFTTTRDGRRIARLRQPLAFFIPEHVPDPSSRASGEELWVEVTIPKRGAPRPIRLGVKKDGVLAPLDLD